MILWKGQWFKDHTVGFFLTIIRMAEEHGKNWTQMPSEKRKHENNMEQQKNSEATEHEAQQIG